MIITKINSNEVIFEDNSNTVKECVINAVAKRIYLSGADLSGAYLRGADLSGADLSGADLRYAHLRGADLRDAHLRGARLRGAYLRGADLRCADLSGADLSGAYLRGADLSGADLSGADLRGADLRGADLCGADLCDAYLSGAYLCGAYLRDAYLCGADLRNAYLSGADLRNAYLSGAKDIPFVPLACPSDGEFIGWKKVSNRLVKLLITEDALRSSATSNKCRCNKAKVLKITDIDGSNPITSVTNDSYTPTQYVVGEMVYPDSFDEDRWNECSNGIHFFINKQEAINY